MNTELRNFSGITTLSEGNSSSPFINNTVFLTGSAVTKLSYSHELFGESFYEFNLKVPRLSNQHDIIPLTISERLLGERTIRPGEKIAIKGQFRSYNKIIDDKSKLMLSVFVRDFADNPSENPNVCELKGYICKPPIYRTTPFNREICDLLLAVNRAYNKSDYIPCIAWGRNARFIRGIDVGAKLAITGRIQSREYIKKLSEEHSETRIAYELSVNKIVLDETTELDEVAATITVQNS
ncbi:MAG: single-stranded DNA-binding protein [Firmicutes bacterium]|nr:single-stranded DNA-binding protein [Bacillota bacterium]